MKTQRAWALVSRRGVVDVDSVSSRKRHVPITSSDESLGRTVRRVRVSVATEWQQWRPLRRAKP